MQGRPEVNGPGSLLFDSPSSLDGPPLRSLGDVLRFDVSREWVYRHWARKSTGLGDPELFGVRVTLVTGTRFSDLAGALTYHFDRQGKVQHISFRGRTADTTTLVEFLVDTYHFERVEAPAGEQVYQVKRGGRPVSELRTYPEPVLWSTSPHGSIGVELELGRPGTNRYLPPRTPKLQIPEVASSPVPRTEAANREQPTQAADDQQESGPSLIGEFRHATPAEEAQLQRMRWPN